MCVDDTAAPVPHETADTPDQPVRRKGDIPPALLDEHALTVVRRLSRFGHEAYLVGGCVRDLLVGLEPKDFDVVTDAKPNRIRRIFRNARIIGRRFRLAHIRFGPQHIIETSTFRAMPVDGVDPGHENVFGTAPEDARRRDFTINALFYDPLHDEILDWVGGLDDLEAGIIRSIGPPRERLIEDPVRMIRAVHFAERMSFGLEDELESSIQAHASELARASHARLYVELLKVLTRARARPTLHRLNEFGVLHHWLPEMVEHLQDTGQWHTATDGTHEEARQGEPEDAPTAHATWNLLGAADHWGLAAHGAEDALALAALTGPWLVAAWQESGRAGYYGFQESCDETLRLMAHRMSMPRRTALRIRDLVWIWLQIRHGPSGRIPERLGRRPAFSPALDLLRLDLMARGCSLDLLDAWQPYDRARKSPEGRPQRQRKGGRRRSRRGGRQGPADGDGVRTEAAAWTGAPAPDGTTRGKGDDHPPRSRRRRRRKSNGQSTS